MRFSPGGRLGPFEVLSRLGAGGMGEVYRARDTRLSREVAIKVLPAEVSADAGRLKRFETEARAVSSLNHPNIVTVFEVGREGDTSYIAMELVEGETLRKLLSGGALPMRKLLAIAAQIADGLARAHAEGIVHRDLKLENVMVRSDGLAKILDFGLAKLTQPDVSGDDRTKTPTLSAGTGAGVVMGTVGYMSPEQARGEPVDFRSDQFSFGAIVYEMATGKRAFDRASAPEILSAIIRDEPEPISTLSPAAPVPLRWIVERCLAKSPEERYGSTQDLARDLANVRDRRSEVSTSGPVSAARHRLRRGLVYAIGAVAVLLALAAGLFLGQRLGKTALPTFRRLTYRRGVIAQARFTPDGETIIYSAAWEGRDPELYSVRIDNPESRFLGLPHANILSISSLGEMAILLVPPWPGTLATLALNGSAPRELMKRVEEADWSPDGKNLAVVIRVAGKSRIEYPIGKTLYETTGNVSLLRVSPDGNLVSFFDRPGIFAGGNVVVVNRAGEARKIPNSAWSDLAWPHSGDEPWLLEHDASLEASELFAITLSGRRKPILRLPGVFRLYDVSREGKLAMEQVSLRSEVFCTTPSDAQPRSLSWLDQSWVVDLSRDGKTLLIEEELQHAIYLRKTDGSPAIRLGEGKPLALSPDGKWVLVSRGDSPARLVLLPTGAGEARSLETGPLERFRSASWLPDGSRVLVSALEKGRHWRDYLHAVSGGTPRPALPEGVEMASGVVSPDGKRAPGLGEDGWRLYPVDGGNAEPLRGIRQDDLPIQWSDDGRFLFVQEAGELPAKVYRLEIASGKKKPWKEFMPMDPAGAEASIVRVSPDGKTWAYSYHHTQSDLFLVDGLGTR